MQVSALKTATVDIEQWGNSLCVRLPAVVARSARLKGGQRVRITVEEGRIIIAPQGDKSPARAARLVRFDPAVHGGEAMVVMPVGHEAW